MTNPTSLEALQAEFKQWRESQPSKRPRIPAHLKERAIALRTDYSANKIIQALGINSTMLNKWSNVSEIQKQPDPIRFVSLPQSELTEHQPKALSSNTSSIQLEFEQPNGNRWRIKGDMDSTHINAFIYATQTAEGHS